MPRSPRTRRAGNGTSPAPTEATRKLSVQAGKASQAIVSPSVGLHTTPAHDGATGETPEQEGEMPKEKFYVNGESNPDKPQIVVAWGETPTPQVLINDATYDRSGLNRLIATLRRARDQVYGSDA